MIEREKVSELSKLRFFPPVPTAKSGKAACVVRTIEDFVASAIDNLPYAALKSVVRFRLH
jgi:hypothetical protein